jgi:hypothetical protein
VPQVRQVLRGKQVHKELQVLKAFRVLQVQQVLLALKDLLVKSVLRVFRDLLVIQVPQARQVPQALGAQQGQLDYRAFRDLPV